VGDVCYSFSATMKAQREKLAQRYSVTTVEVEEAVDYVKGYVWGGDAAHTIAYRPRHPSIRFLPLRFPGRGIELGTEKQYYLWRKISVAMERLRPGKALRVTLAQLAASVGLSRSSVSRFLRKLDWWRAIDVCAVRGRGGCVYIWPSPKPSEDAPEFKNVPPNMMAAARWKLLRHRVWQARFNRWRERYEEVREMAKHSWQASYPVCLATLAK